MTGGIKNPFIFLIIILAYLFFTVVLQKPLIIGKWVIPNLSPQLAIGQLIVSSLDWSLAAMVFYILLKTSVSLSYPTFFGIFILAQVAGLASNVPGGLGVFETVMILLLAPFIESEELLGTLLIYRGIYYFIPLGIAILLLGKYELSNLFNNKKNSIPTSFVNNIKRIDITSTPNLNLIKLLIQDFSSTN